MDLLAWAIIFALIAVNGLYVAAEFAAVGVRHSQVSSLAKRGNRRATGLLPILEDSRQLDRYIAACQIGITFSSLLLGAYGQSRLAGALAPWVDRWWGAGPVTAHSLAAGAVLVGLTVLQVLLGELVPKSVALQFPVQTALLTFPPLRGSLPLFAWFIAVLNGSGNLLLRLIGFTAPGQRHLHSPEEIALLLKESRQGGLLPSEAHRRLQQALRLTERTARQIMVPRREMEAINLALPLEEVLRQVVASPYTRLPAYRDTLDQLQGVLHTKDFIARYLAQGVTGDLESLLRPPLYVPESFSADRLLVLFRKQRQQQALVVDEFGGIEGLVTLEDVLSGMLGELTDEFKGRRSVQPTRLPDGRVRMPGELPLDQAEPWTGVRWRGESETVGGRVVEALGHLPRAGEVVTVDGVRVEVERVREHAIATVLVTPPPPAEEET